jgi:hypothetical protein
MRRTLKILAFGIALIFTGVFLNACGKGHAQTRFVAASPDAPNVDLLIDGAAVATNLSFPSTNGSYVTITSGNRTVEVRQTGTTTDFVNASNVDFIKHDQYTLYFTGLTKANPPNQTVNQVPDDNTPPASGKIKLRMFHASPSFFPSPPANLPARIDVYVVAPGTDITNLSPNISSLAYQQASQYLTIAAGSYELIVTQPNSKTRRIDEPSLAFTAGQIRTFVMLDIPGGGGFSGTLLELSDLN